MFLDYSVAFETINHDILISKLEHFGIRGNALSWFSSYLKDRKQFVQYNDTKSNSRILNISVPQGSVLGPCLFNLYINDFTRCSKKLNCILSADDSTLYLSGENFWDVISCLNVELNSVYEWTISNKLTLNLKKTNYMIFNRNRNLDTSLHEAIKINNETINQVKDATFLGLIIQSNLKWNSHIQFVANKVNKKCGILYLIRDLVPKNILIGLYYSLVYSHILYCNVIWGNSCNNHLKPLVIAQKRIVKTLTYHNRSYSSEILYKEYNLLNIHKINLYSLCIFVFKNIHSQLSDIEFVNSAAMHNYNIRDNHRLTLPSIGSSQSQKSVKYSGASAWNDLPVNIRSINSIVIFKKQLKEYLISDS